MPTRGSQELLHIAMNKRRELLLASLRSAQAIGRRESVEWVSPLANDNFREYRDGAAIHKLRLQDRLRVPLSEFWPARGAVWDALAVAGGSRPILVEAKAHIPEIASPGSRASGASLKRIMSGLEATRRYLAPRSRASWTGLFYQYANRLAHQFFLRERNEIESSLVFLCFTNAVDMDGPTSEGEWQGAIRLVHAVLGLPKDLARFGIYHAFLDANNLTDVD